MEARRFITLLASLLKMNEDPYAREKAGKKLKLKINDGVLEDSSMKFTERFNQLRKEKGVTQTEIADKIGLTKQSISLYSTGKRTPDIRTLDKMCDCLDVPADYLLGRSDVRRPENTVLIHKLGLTDAGIEQVMNMRNKYFKNDKTLNDARTPMDILNKLLESVELLSVLNGLKYISSDRQADLECLLEESSCEITSEDVHEMALKKIVARMISSMK